MHYLGLSSLSCQEAIIWFHWVTVHSNFGVQEEEILSLLPPFPLLFARRWLCQQRSIWSSYGLSSGHVWMWELDCEESWAPKNWCFWTVVLEKTLEHPLDCKEIQPVHSKGDQSWVFIGRTDVEAETPIFWPPDAKSWLIWKDPDVRKDWRQEEKGTTEDEMVGWHHQLNEHEFG